MTKHNMQPNDDEIRKKLEEFMLESFDLDMNTSTSTDQPSQNLDLDEINKIISNLLNEHNAEACDIWHMHSIYRPIPLEISDYKENHQFKLYNFGIGLFPQPRKIKIEKTFKERFLTFPFKFWEKYKIIEVPNHFYYHLSS